MRLFATRVLTDRLSFLIAKVRQTPRFSMFGVGPYSFAPWKVAISGFYKKLEFKVVGNVEGTPIVLDDTSYFLPCEAREEAEFFADMLNSQTAQDFFRAFIFWDSKRPITIELLRKIDLVKLARELGVEATIQEYVVLKQRPPVSVQKELFLS